MEKHRANEAATDCRTLPGDRWQDVFRNGATKDGNAAESTLRNANFGESLLTFIFHLFGCRFLIRHSATVRVSVCRNVCSRTNLQLSLVRPARARLVASLDEFIGDASASASNCNYVYTIGLRYCYYVNITAIDATQTARDQLLKSKRNRNYAVAVSKSSEMSAIRMASLFHRKQNFLYAFCRHRFWIYFKNLVQTFSPIGNRSLYLLFRSRCAADPRAESGGNEARRAAAVGHSEGLVRTDSQRVRIRGL